MRIGATRGCQLVDLSAVESPPGMERVTYGSPVPGPHMVPRPPIRAIYTRRLPVRGASGVVSQIGPCPSRSRSQRSGSIGLLVGRVGSLRPSRRIANDT
jgi:hypothetical protein